MGYKKLAEAYKLRRFYTSIFIKHRCISSWWEYVISCNQEEGRAYIWRTKEALESENSSALKKTELK